MGWVRHRLLSQMLLFPPVWELAPNWKGFNPCQTISLKQFWWEAFTVCLFAWVIWGHGRLSTMGIPKCLPVNTVELFIPFPGNIILYISLDPIPRQDFRNRVICVSSTRELCQLWESYTDLRTKAQVRENRAVFLCNNQKSLVSWDSLYLSAMWCCTAELGKAFWCPDDLGEKRKHHSVSMSLLFLCSLDLYLCEPCESTGRSVAQHAWLISDIESL